MLTMTTQQPATTLALSSDGSGPSPATTLAPVASFTRS